MAIVGISSTGTREEHLSSDPDKGTDKATKFFVGSISARNMATIKDGALAYADKKNTKLEIKGNAVAVKTVKFGLKGWENFLDDKGAPITFVTEEAMLGGKKVVVASDESLDRLAFADILELADLISGVNKVDEEERKNS